jgi:hypothetical protein
MACGWLRYTTVWHPSSSGGMTLAEVVEWLHPSRTTGSSGCALSLILNEEDP